MHAGMQFRCSEEPFDDASVDIRDANDYAQETKKFI